MSGLIQNMQCSTGQYQIKFCDIALCQSFDVPQTLNNQNMIWELHATYLSANTQTEIRSQPCLSTRFASCQRATMPSRIRVKEMNVSLGLVYIYPQIIRMHFRNKFTLNYGCSLNTTVPWHVMPCMQTGRSFWVWKNLLPIFSGMTSMFMLRRWPLRPDSPQWNILSALGSVDMWQPWVIYTHLLQLLGS